MALVSCPSCAKRMSNKAMVCPHCQFNVAEIDPADVAEVTRRQRDRLRRQLQMHSMIAMTLFAAGALLIYTGTVQADNWQGWAGKLVLSAGFLLYMVTRVRILIFNRKAR